MDPEYLLVYITVPDADTGELIARRLLDKKLAACVKIVADIRSLFHWKGRVDDESELLLIVTTRASLFREQLIAEVQEMHPYEVPEILALPVALGNDSYLSWIDESTRS